ncbi:MAG: ATP-binding protein [Chromatiaceae bacterium]
MIDSLTRIIQASLLQLRWLSVMAMALAALVSPYILGPSALMGRLLVFTGAIAAINLVFMLAARFLGAAMDVPLFFSPLVQLTFDLLAWSAYIFISGGATNPLISIFLPLVAIGALVLGQRQAWFFALAAILIYSFLWNFYVPLYIADYQMAGTLHLVGMWLVFTLSAVMVVWFILQLTASIRSRDQELAAARERAIRDDWLISLGSQAAGAAHELSTPLATLNILVDDLLDDSRLAAALAPDVQAMKAPIQRCKKILSQLAARAGHASGGEPPYFPARAWVQRLLFAWQSQHPRAELRLDISPELDRFGLPADLAIERALANLLDNALQAQANLIQVRALARAGTLEMRVADNGTGIPPATLEAIKQRQPLISTQGMGVGLLLGRVAVERRGGSLSFLPSATGGATAQLCLPLVAMRETSDAG